MTLEYYRCCTANVSTRYHFVKYWQFLTCAHICQVHQSTAMGQVVACAPVTQRARVRFPVGTSFLGEVFSGFFLTCKTCQEALGPKAPEYHLAIIIIHNHSLREPMT